MKNAKFDRFWHRRTSEAILLLSGALGGLFLWTIFSDAVPSDEFYVSFAPGACAAATFALTLVSYFVAPRHKLRQSALINYAFLTASFALFAYFDKSASAAPIALLAVILAAGPALGASGAAISLLAAGSFVASEYFLAQVSLRQIAVLSAALFVPILAMALVWLRQHRTTKEDKSYAELASKLNQVSGTSEIVISTIDDGVIAIDNKGVINLINPAAQQLIGWGDQEAVGLSYKSVLKLLDKQDNAVKDADPVNQVLVRGETFESEGFSVVTQSDKKFIAGLTITPIGEKSSGGAVIVFRDITKAKKDERQRAEFISTASHEMRTPVASIEGYLGLALNPQTATIDERARGYVTKAHESSQHLGRLFQDLLDISKADDNRISNNPKIVNVADFVKDIVEGLAPKAAEKGLSMIFVPEASVAKSKELKNRRINPVFYANVDNDHLREIVQNLIENAIKYTPTGSVSVDVRGDDQNITISVADTGIGIPREDVAHLFQKFYRVDNSDTREIGGTGLGLYLCRRLAETIGGRLWVESEYKKGSTFYLSVPRANGVNTETAAAQPSDSDSDSDSDATEPFATSSAESTLTQIQDLALAMPLENTAQDLPQTISGGNRPFERQQSATNSASSTAQPAAQNPQTSAPAPAEPLFTQNTQTVQQPEPTAPVASTSQPATPQNPNPRPLTNTPLSTIEAAPDRYIEQLRDEIKLNIPPRQ